MILGATLYVDGGICGSVLHVQTISQLWNRLWVGNIVAIWFGSRMGWSI